MEYVFAVAFHMHILMRVCGLVRRELAFLVAP